MVDGRWSMIVELLNEVQLKVVMRQRPDAKAYI